MMRASRILAATLGIACAAIAGPAVVASFAQEAPVPPGAGGEATPSGAETDLTIHPDAVSSFQVRVYDISPKKLWKGLIEVLTQSGYPPEEVDDKGRRLKTSFVDFNARDYSEAVADPPPRLGPGYHVLQMNVVRQGKVSIEGIVTKGEKGGAVLSLRARILVEGLDQAKRIRVLVDRRSAGVIESDFLRHIEDTLGLERL